MKKALLLLLALVFMFFVRESAYAQQDIGYANTNDSGDYAAGRYRYDADVARVGAVVPRLREDMTQLQEDITESDSFFDNSIAQFVDTYFNHY